MALSDWLQDCLSGRVRKKLKAGGRALCHCVLVSHVSSSTLRTEVLLVPRPPRSPNAPHTRAPHVCTLRMHVVSHFQSAFHRLLPKRRSGYSGSYRVGPNWVPRRRIYHDSSATGSKGRPVLPIFLLRFVYCPTIKILAKL